MNDTWDTLMSECMSCTACELYRTRTNVVFGTGNTNAKILLSAKLPATTRIRPGFRLWGARVSFSTNIYMQ